MHNINQSDFCRTRPPQTPPIAIPTPHLEKTASAQIFSHAMQPRYIGKSHSAIPTSPGITLKKSKPVRTNPSLHKYTLIVSSLKNVNRVSIKDLKPIAPISSPLLPLSSDLHQLPVNIYKSLFPHVVIEQSKADLLKDSTHLERLQTTILNQKMISQILSFRARQRISTAVRHILDPCYRQLRVYTLDISDRESSTSLSFHLNHSHILYYASFDEEGALLLTHTSLPYRCKIEETDILMRDDVDITAPIITLKGSRSGIKRLPTQLLNNEECNQFLSKAACEKISLTTGHVLSQRASKISRYTIQLFKNGKTHLSLFQKKDKEYFMQFDSTGALIKYSLPKKLSLPQEQEFSEFAQR